MKGISRTCLKFFVQKKVTGENGLRLSTIPPLAGAAGELPQVLMRMVTLTVEVQIINQVDNVILWESSSVSVQGEFLEDSGTEDEGRATAIELLVQRIVDGAQSNW